MDISYWKCLLSAVVMSVLLWLFSAIRSVRYYYCYFVYIVGVVTLALLHIPVFLLHPRSIKNLEIAAVTHKHLTKPIGIEWELRNGEILAEKRGAIIVANHQSIFDVLGMWNIWDVMGRCTAVAKKGLIYVPFFGFAAWLGGVIFIDRERPKEAYEIIKKRSRLIHEGKSKIWFFVEGTRNRKGENLLPFKKGAFRMAIECKAPIIPVIYSPYYFIDGEKKIFDKGKITVSVLKPIPVDNYNLENMDSLISYTYNIMNLEYSKLKEQSNYEVSGVSKSS